jgi:DNA-binding PadR family transcriptional regulator
VLYPLLLKLDHEGSIVSEWGASEDNRRARFYRLNTTGRKQREAETRDWEPSSRAFLKSKRRTWHEIPAPFFHSPLEPRHRAAWRSS